jgi:hypothetical protein
MNNAVIHQLDHSYRNASFGSCGEELYPAQGGLGRAAQLFGDDLPRLLDELNEALAA